MSKTCQETGKNLKIINLTKGGKQKTKNGKKFNAQSSKKLEIDTGIYNCSRSWRRAEKVDKRMVLEHTHGLFIT